MDVGGVCELPVAKKGVEGVGICLSADSAHLSGTGWGTLGSLLSSPGHQPGWTSSGCLVRVRAQLCGQGSAPPLAGTLGRV